MPHELAAFIGSGREVIRFVVPFVFGFFLLGFAVLGAVLDYHWRKYAVRPLRLLQFRMFYFGAGGILFFIMAYAYIIFLIQ